MDRTIAVNAQCESRLPVRRRSKYVVWIVRNVVKSRCELEDGLLEELLNDAGIGSAECVGAIRVLAASAPIEEDPVSCLGIAVAVDRKSTRLNSSHSGESRMPSSA